MILLMFKLRHFNKPKQYSQLPLRKVLMETKFSDYKSNIQGAKIRDTFWDVSTEFFEENKGHEY